MKKFIILCFTLVVGLTLSACSPYSDDDFFEPEKTSAYKLAQYRSETGFEINKIPLESNDGKTITKIYGVYVGNTEQINVNKVVLYAHDKSNNIDYYWPRIKNLTGVGLNDFGIFIIDYRGYGESEGTPSEPGLYADINAALVWLEEKGLTGDRLIMYGYGLGSAVAIELTAYPRSLVPAKLIIESPFASIESLIQETTLQSTPGSYISNLNFNNVEKIKQITQPLLWMHGSEDKVYDIDKHGQLVYDNHPGINNTRFRVEGASHFDVAERFDGGIEAYVHQVLTFISAE